MFGCFCFDFDECKCIMREGGEYFICPLGTDPFRPRRVPSTADKYSHMLGPIWEYFKAVYKTDITLAFDADISDIPESYLLYSLFNGRKSELNVEKDEFANINLNELCGTNVELLYEYSSEKENENCMIFNIYETEYYYIVLIHGGYGLYPNSVNATNLINNLHAIKKEGTEKQIIDIYEKFHSDDSLNKAICYFNEMSKDDKEKARRMFLEYANQCFR